MLEVRELRLVQAIQEHGSLVRAARVLGMGQPALTRALAGLEAKVKGPLFDRSPKGVIATDLGRAILAEAQDILGRLARLDRYVAETRGDQVRDLVVIAGGYVGESVVLAAAMRMPALYPRIRLRIIQSNWADVPRAVVAREAAMGLLDLRGFDGDPGLEVEPLRPQPGVFVVRAGHPLAGRAEVDLAAILGFPFVFIGRVPHPVQAPLAAARERARAVGALHPAFPALVHESPTVLLRLVAGSDAVMGATAAIAGQALASGELVALPWRAPWTSVHPGVVRLRGGRAMPEAEQAFLDLLRSADLEIEREAIALFARLGLSAACS
jgi:DNA-binding transcriptional LysR family regulator